MLHLNTFGKTPAAEHLVRQLNSRVDPAANRSVSVAIKTFNANVAAVVESVDQCSMSAKVAANLLRLLRTEAGTITVRPEGLFTNDMVDFYRFVTNLTRNVVVGNIKRAIRQVTTVRKIQNGNSTLAKAQSRGVSVAEPFGPNTAVNIMGYRAGYVSYYGTWIPDFPLTWEIADPVTAELLHQRSLQRIARRGPQGA